MGAQGTVSLCSTHRSQHWCMAKSNYYDAAEGGGLKLYSDLMWPWQNRKTEIIQTGNVCAANLSDQHDGNHHLYVHYVLYHVGEILCSRLVLLYWNRHTLMSDFLPLRGLLSFTMWSVLLHVKRCLIWDEKCLGVRVEQRSVLGSGWFVKYLYRAGEFWVCIYSKSHRHFVPDLDPSPFWLYNIGHSVIYFALDQNCTEGPGSKLFWCDLSKR